MGPELFDSANSLCHTLVVNAKDKEDFMSLQSHLVELEKRHSDLERELEEAMRHPSMDSLEIASLKRRKLLRKDEIEKIRTDPLH